MNTIHAVANRRLASAAASKLVYPAADRNKDPILGILKKIISPGSNQVLLEVSSGTGQHIAHFAPHFPQITFFPSEYDSQLLETISAYVSGLTNVREPIVIDASADYTTWANGMFGKNTIDYIYNANMIHISPYKCTIGLFKAAGELLKPNGIMITYGPYAMDGKIVPESNVNFDRSLRSQNSEWGLRDLTDLKLLAKKNQIHFVELYDMPANNKTVIWKKIQE